jgi:hypothetical protein
MSRGDAPQSKPAIQTIEVARPAKDATNFSSDVAKPKTIRLYAALLIDCLRNEFENREPMPDATLAAVKP